ncbi:MAG: hypothetical protein AUG44_10385 [Actinobacteria bacterium 13_1_20CM_3_71_11]|nr:MAG: hypothetical protein AUG44_10385 [Actinobacteria bacterium 13_1_20CM_3_71_11]TML21606.1 MAG: DUF881 domain-containing protein [Actinomycetota bacterium]
MADRSSPSSWGKALRRAALALLPGRTVPRGPWSVLVPIAALFAGLLFSMSARTAQGTTLRDDRNPQLSSLIADRQRQIDQQAHEAALLRRQVDQQTTLAGGSDADIAEQQLRADSRRASAGLSALHGPGLTVRLNDAPRRPDGSLPQGASPDDLVVHQQDVQAVVNALWAGGADAMTIMGVRVISTSAVRCVGNTLLLNGRVYSPPFVITAIGDPDRMRAALDQAPGVRAFQEAATAFGLDYQVKPEGDVTVPAYDGSTSLQYAEATD